MLFSVFSWIENCCATSKHKEEMPFIYSASCSTLICQGSKSEAPSLWEFRFCKITLRKILAHIYFCNLFRSVENEPWVNEFLKVSLWEWVDMTFVYEIDYNVGNLKLWKMLQSMELWNKRSRIAVLLGITVKSASGCGHQACVRMAWLSG